jgi:thiol-disulfide isomerase/thioredoxin
MKSVKLFLALMSVSFLSTIHAQDMGQRGPNDRIHEGTLRVGEAAPEIQLKNADGSHEFKLSSFKGRKAVVLIFGSYTCPPFRSYLTELEELYQKYKDRVEFVFIYIREAHPEDGWQIPMNQRDGVVFKQPTTLEERSAVATKCVQGMKVSIPTVVDSMDNKIGELYAGWPNRLYIIHKDGTIAFKSQSGPRGFKVSDVSQRLEKLLEN